MIDWHFDVIKYDYIQSRKCCEKHDDNTIQQLEKHGYKGFAAKYNAVKCTLEYYRVCAQNALNGTLSQNTLNYIENSTDFV